MERVKSGWQQGRIIYTYTYNGYNNYESSEYSIRCRTIVDDNLIRELDMLYFNSDGTHQRMDRTLQRMHKAKLLEGDKFDLQATGSYKVYFAVKNSLENLELANDLITQISSFEEHENLAIRYSIACLDNEDAVGEEIIFYLPGDRNLISDDLAAKAWLNFFNHVDRAFYENNIIRSHLSVDKKTIGYYSYYEVGVNGLVGKPNEDVVSFDLAGSVVKGKYGEPIISSLKKCDSSEFPDCFTSFLNKKKLIHQELA